MIAEVHVAAVDCEAVRDVIGQPANVVSALLMAVPGVWLVVQSRRSGRPTRRLGAGLVGMALVLVGIGSVAFHGPGGWSAHVAHDATITVLVVMAAVALELDRGAARGALLTGAALATAAVILARMATPLAYIPTTALAAAWLAVASWRRHRAGLVQPGWAMAALATTVGAVVVLALSRTGGPLCRPDSLLQGHALWHLAMAAVVVLAAKALSLIDDPGGSVEI